MIASRLLLFSAGVVSCLGLISSQDSTSVLAWKPPNSEILIIAQASNNIAAQTPLKSGNQGENVKILQTRLKELGYFSTEINGIYDEKTKLAVSEFQKSQNLSVDGNASPILQQRLEDVLFDKYMNNGYEATEKKEFVAAQENFKKAINLRNNNLYAQKAIANIERYLNRIDEQKNKQKQHWQLEVLIIVLTILAVGLGIFFFIQIFSKEKQVQEIVDFSQKNPSYLDTDITNNYVSKKNNSEIIPENLPKQQGEIQLKNQQISPHELSLKPTSNRLAKIDIVDELIANLRTSEPNTRKKAIWELAQRADSRAMEPLVQLMIQADSQERTLILEAISQISNRTLRPVNRALAISLQDENPQVRVNAIRDLTRIYELIAQVNRQLYQAVSDPEKEVQETAQWALEMLNQMQLPTLPTNFEELPKNNKRL